MTKRETNPAAQSALIPLFGGLEKKPRPLTRDVISVGRARGCDIILEAPDISTLHCMLYRTAEGFRIRDCGSRTGTRVNGSPVRNQLLVDEDVLHIGPFSFQAHLPEKRGDAIRKPDPEHLDRSRQNLVRLALQLRRRNLQLEKGQGAGGDLRRHEADLKTRIRAYDQRANQLEEAERDLEQERSQLRQEQKAHQALAQTVEREHQDLTHQREEIMQLREQLAVEKGEMVTLFEHQRHVLSEAEAALKEQRLELSRMMGDLREMQQAVRQQRQTDVPALAQENEHLRQLVVQWQDKAAALEAQGPAPVESTAEPPQDPAILQELHAQAELLDDLKVQLAALEKVRDQSAQLQKDNEQIKKWLTEKDHMLGEKDKQIVELNKKVERTGTPANSVVDLETYENELNQYRQQLDTDRARLNAEMDALRLRNAELDEATREMEMGLSRERAELARERMRLDRLREEVRSEMERMQREAGVRESLAPLQKLRDELNQKKGVPTADNRPNDRLRTLRNQLQE